MDANRAEAVRRLRERGLPQTDLYIHAEISRMTLERERRLAFNTSDLPRRERTRGVLGVAGPMPRAEPDQVIRTAGRDDRPGRRGRIMGRYEGGITSGLTQKEDLSAPTMDNSTWQMDLMDMSTKEGESGFGLLAVDVHSRTLYGVLVSDKTLPGLIEAFSRLLKQRGNDDPNKAGNKVGAPATIDTDKERAWITDEWHAEMQRRGIQQRFKTDRFTPNSLGMIDEK